MHKLENQNGAVMLLVAILAAALLMLAGLAIDSAVIANSKVQQRHASEYMALGAIKAFNESTASAPFDKLTDARNRAEQLARENSFLAKSFLKNPTSEIIGDTRGVGANGRIIPGIWYFKAGTNSCDGLDTSGNPILDPITNSPIPRYPAPCPCSSTNNHDWAAPCFRELDFSNPAEATLTPNSTRVELNTATNSPIQTLFARVKGQETISINSRATAVQLPRRAVFLIDLSRHTHSETHTPYPTACGANNPPLFGGYGCQPFASEYTFKTTTNCSSAWSTPVLCPDRLSCTFDSGGTSTNTNNFYHSLYNGRYRPTPTSSLVDILSLTRTGATNKTTHFKDDYHCFKSPSFTDRLPGGLTTPIIAQSNYLIDYHYGATNVIGETYDGAEPLNTMLIGLNEALQQFKNNLVPGDEITAIGFDGSASIDKRTLGPVTINVSNSTFQNLEYLSNISLADPSNPNHNSYLNARFINNMFFPRVDDNTMDKQENIVEALKRAKEVLISAGQQTSENFVVLIGDGISSCYETTNTTEIAAAGTAKRCGTSGSSTLCSVCSNSYAGFKNSFDQAEKIIREEYIPNNIKFHFIQIGLRSTPHFLQRAQGTGTNKTCMSVEDMKNSNPPLATTDTTFEHTNGTTTDEDEFKKITYGEISFPPATEFGRLANESKGKYLPIMNPCDAGVDKTVDFNNECKNNSAINNPTLGIPSSENRIDGNFSDSRGRVTCDILGRDRRQQMRDAIAEVFNEDPYVIVD